MEDSSKKHPLPSPIFPGTDNSLFDRKKTPNEARYRPPQTPVKATPQQSKMVAVPKSAISFESTPARRLEEGGFEGIQPLSHGSYGQVFSCKKGGKDFACKVMPLMGSGKLHKKQEAEREVLFSKIVAHHGGHPNVLQHVDHWEEGGFCHLQSELCKADLRDVLLKERPCENDVVNYLCQMLQGAAFIHSLGLVHMDLKPENVLLAYDDTLKICDFGHVTKIGHWSMDKLGEPTYVAPEFQRFMPTLKLSDEETIGVEVVAPAADVWALGLILLEMITGIELPREKSLRESLQQLEQPVTWEWLEKNFGHIAFPASPEIKHLLSRMLDPNPASRISIQEALKLDVFSAIVLPLDLSKVDVSIDEKMEHSSLDDFASLSSTSSPNSPQEEEEEDEISFLMDNKKQKVDNHAQLLREMQRRESFELTTGEISLAQDLEDRMNLRPKALFNVNG